MTRSKPFQSLTISMIFMMLALTIQDVAAQRRARGSASRGSVRYAGGTSTEGRHQTQTRRGTLDTNTSVDGNKTHRETSAEGRYGRSAEGSSTVEREDDKVKWEREVETDSGLTRTVEGELEYGEKIEREATTTNRYGDEVKREQKLENKGGYLEYEGKTETSWGREVEVEGVAGRDYWGRPVAYGTRPTVTVTKSSESKNWRTRAATWNTREKRKPAGVEKLKSRAWPAGTTGDGLWLTERSTPSTTETMESCAGPTVAEW